MAIDLRSTWRPAKVITNRPVANGSMWVALAATDEGPAAFQPGHVLGLGMKLDDHTLIRHAYTVSRGEPAARRFEHLSIETYFNHHATPSDEAVDQLARQFRGE